MDAEFRRDLLEVTLPFAEALKPGTRVESKQLFDAGYWNSLDEHVQRTMGRYVAMLVRQGALPLRRCSVYTGSRHNLYERF